MEVARKLMRRSATARACLWCVVLSDAAAIPIGILYAQYLGSLSTDAILDGAEMAPAEFAYGLISLVQFGILLFSATFFIRWFHLVYSNLSLLSEEPTNYHPRWAIWGFVVPIINLVRPLRLMQEVWTRTSSRWQEERSRVLGLEQPRDHVNLWWGLLIATGIIGEIIGRFSFGATTATQTLYATWAEVFANALDIGAAVVALMLIRNVTDLQKPLLDHAPVSPIA